MSPQTQCRSEAFDIQRVLSNSYVFMNDLAFSRYDHLGLHSIRPENAVRKLKAKKYRLAKTTEDIYLQDEQNLSLFDKAA